MANGEERLPEGTDAVIEDIPPEDDESTAGAEDGDTEAKPASGAGFKEQAAAFKDQATAKAADLRGQATEQVFAFAAQGKDRASEALDGVAKMVSEAAAQVEDKLGPQYGGYARQAADAVSGFATTLRQKEVEDLFEDARGVVRNSPAIAIGAAAAAGFVLARLIRAGSEALETSAKPTDAA